MFSIPETFESMARFIERVIAEGLNEPPVPPSFRREIRALENGWADERRVAARGEDRRFRR
jgi:hypothetical protein